MNDLIELVEELGVPLVTCAAKRVQKGEYTPTEQRVRRKKDRGVDERFVKIRRDMFGASQRVFSDESEDIKFAMEGITVQSEHEEESEVDITNPLDAPIEQNTRKRRNKHKHRNADSNHRSNVSSNRDQSSPTQQPLQPVAQPLGTQLQLGQPVGQVLFPGQVRQNGYLAVAAVQFPCPRTMLQPSGLNDALKFNGSKRESVAHLFGTVLADQLGQALTTITGVYMQQGLPMPSLKLSTYVYDEGVIVYIMATETSLSIKTIMDTVRNQLEKISGYEPHEQPAEIATQPNQVRVGTPYPYHGGRFEQLHIFWDSLHNKYNVISDAFNAAMEDPGSIHWANITANVTTANHMQFNNMTQQPGLMLQQGIANYIGRVPAQQMTPMVVPTPIAFGPQVQFLGRPTTTPQPTRSSQSQIGQADFMNNSPGAAVPITSAAAVPMTSAAAVPMTFGGKFLVNLTISPTSKSTVDPLIVQ